VAVAKLTLNVDAEVIEQAKRIAAEQGTSVSALFGRFIKALADEQEQRKPLGKLTRRASGLIDLKGRSDKAVLAEALQEKYAL